jgi:hypothetical protein
LFDNNVLKWHTLIKNWCQLPSIVILTSMEVVINVCIKRIIALSEHTIIAAKYMFIDHFYFVSFCKFFCIVNFSFRRTIHALALNHWTCGRVSICHHHYAQQHVLQQLGCYNYYWRTHFQMGLLDQAL